jgi:predicted NBD/HSP70 family sugar kinase
MESGPGLANQRAVRRHNLGVVLRHVAERGPRSRATIALETGLNKTTVSSLVTELIGLELLVERGLEQRGTVGRPGLVVELSDGGVVALGLEINVDYLAVRALDLTGAERDRRLDARDNRGVPEGEVLDRLAALASGALEQVHEAGLRPVGATVAVPGLVDAAGGVLLVAPNLGWKDVAIAAELHERLAGPPFPLAADNEANLAALAELWEGTARGLRDVLYVSGEIGIGAGIVIGGELFRGSQGFGGEFGHMTMDPGGRPCACGSRGCLETVASLEALLEGAGLDAAEPGSGEPVAALASRAGAGDERALAALRDSGRWLGIAIASAANLLNFQAVVLGGFFAQLEPWLAAPIASELERHVLASDWSVPRVLASTLGPEAAVRGAAALSLRRVLADPVLAAPA